MAKVYPLHFYDEGGLLKIRPILFFITILLLKYPISLLLPFIPLIDTSYIKNYTYQYVDPVLFIGSIPAVVLLVVLIKRSSDASVLVKRLWHKGRLLLFISAIIQFFWLGLSLFVEWKEVNLLSLSLCYIDLMIVFYLFRSKYTQDVFNEFPSKG